MRMNQDDQIRFLLVCIKYTTNGKPNWDAVVQETEVVSKGAAAKRYERLVAQYKIKDSYGGYDGMRMSREGPSKGSRMSRKRKLDDTCFSPLPDDDDDDFDIPPERKKPETKTRIKPEPMSPMPMNYPAYMYPHMMAPPYMQRPMQPFMPTNSASAPPFVNSNYQFNHMQQSLPNWPYQPSPQQPQFAMPHIGVSSTAHNYNRNPESLDGLFHNNTTFSSFENMLNDPATQITGNLLEQGLDQALLDNKQIPQGDTKNMVASIKTEPISEASSQLPDSKEASFTTPCQDSTLCEDTITLSTVTTPSGLGGGDSHIGMQQYMKQEELGDSITVSD